MRILLRLVVCLAAVTLPIAAQVVTGTILGNVTDPSGGAVAGAHVTIINVDTNVKADVTTNGDGQYTRPYLPPGPYQVTVDAPGFAQFSKTGIALSTSAQVRVDAKLGMAAANQSIVVSAGSETLQTDTSDLSQTVSQTEVHDLPNVNSNPLYFAITIPGIVPIDSSRGNFMDPDQVGVGDNSRVAMTSFSVNGGQPATSNIQLDGALNTGAAFNEIAVMPSLDAIGEVRVITNNYSAEFGRAGGGVIAIQTKSGGNRFHGTLHENLRNSALNANTFGNNSFGRDTNGDPLRPKAPFSTNSFGGTFSGPVRLPHLYNGRDRTFFFFSYEGLRRSQGTNSYYTMPTALERQGDFSKTVAQVLAPDGSTVLTPVQVFLPFPDTTTINTISNGVYQLNRQQASSNGVLNAIPQQYLNQTAVKIMSYYPLPNIAPLNADGSRNFFTNAPAHTRTDQIIAKLDHNFSESQRAFFRWTTDWTQYLPSNLFAQTNPSANNNPPISQFNPTATLGYTASLSPSSIIDLRANLTRINLIQQPQELTDLTGMGFSQAEAAAAATSIYPLIGGMSYPQQGLSRYAYESNHSTNYAFSGSYTKMLGNWTIKVGGEYTALMYNFFQPTINSIYFNAVGSGFSAACSGTGCPSLGYNNVQGSTAANFLMGAADGGSGSGQFATADPAMALKNGYWAGYSQNDWKVSRRLTVNLGARWEFQGPLTDRYDRLSQFDLSGINATGTRGRYLFSGKNGNPRWQRDADWHDFAPRVGLAYRLDPKTVIRSAYGISYIMSTGVGSGAQGFGTDGFMAPSYIQIRPNSGIATGLDILQNPFNDAFSKGGRTTGTDPANPAYLGTTVTAILRNHSAQPYVQQWNFTVQRQLPWALNLQAAYVGTKGTRLTLNNFGLNQYDDIAQPVLDNARQQYRTTGVNPLTTRVPNPFYGIVTGNTNLSQSTIQQLYLSLPYPAYGQVYDFNDRAGSSSYHALQLTLQRAFKQGYQLSAGYTWSKSIDFGGNLASSATWGQAYYSPTNAGLDRAVSGNNVPRRIVVSFLAELPFGKGKPMFTGTPVVSQALGGWKVSGIAMFSDGFPLAITGGSNIGYNNGGRPNLIADPVLPKEYQVIGDGKTAYPLPDGRNIVVPANYKLYFNPDAFSVPVINIPTASGTGNQWVTDIYWYGTSPREISSLHGPGVNNWDLNLARTLRVNERSAFEFRLDAYNAFNRVKWANPVAAFGGTNVNDAAARGRSTSSTFGMLSTATQSNFPRYLQLSLRLRF